MRNRRKRTEDNSLPPAEYVQLGLPSHDRPWSGTDMAKAASVLGQIAHINVTKLPRYKSHRSGVVFSRITADENLDPYRNPSLPLAPRLSQASAYWESSSAIMKLYLAPFTQGATFGDELVELIGLQLRTTVVVLRLLDEFVATLDTEDPTYGVRMEGVQGTRKGVAIIVAGCLETLADRTSYGTLELKRLAGYLRETLPQLLPRIPEGTRTETLLRLRAFKNDPKMDDLRPELLELLSAVEGTVASPAP